MARTVNFLTENNLLQYEQLQAKISEIQTLFDDTTAELKAVEGRLSDMALLIKNVENFRRTYPAYKNYKQARNKQKAYEENESAILIHTAAKKEMCIRDSVCEEIAYASLSMRDKQMFRLPLEAGSPSQKARIVRMAADALKRTDFRCNSDLLAKQLHVLSTLED